MIFAIAMALHTNLLIDSTSEVGPCNGADALCSKLYNDVTFPSTHNAHSYKQNLYLNALGNTNINNQNVDLKKQLQDGIRAFKIPIHLQDQNATVCHGVSGEKLVTIQKKACRSRTRFLKSLCSAVLNKVKPCFLDRSKIILSNLLEIVKTFMDKNKDEVLTIFLEAYVGFKLLHDSFIAANISHYLHVQPKNKLWPTLGEMIYRNQRLVVFANRDVDTFNHSLTKYPFNSEKHFVWSSKFDFKTNEDLLIDTADLSTINKSWLKDLYEVPNKLWILQHFVTPLIAGRVANAKNVNHFNSLQLRHHNYKNYTLVNANFIWVDFYQYPLHSNLFSFVKYLNKD